MASVVDTAGLLEALKTFATDVLLLNANLRDGPLTGFQLLSQIRELHPRVKVVLLLNRPDPHLIVEGFRCGLKGAFALAGGRSPRGIHQTTGCSGAILLAPCEAKKTGIVLLKLPTGEVLLDALSWTTSPATNRIGFAAAVIHGDRSRRWTVQGLLLGGQLHFSISAKRCLRQ